MSADSPTAPNPPLPPPIALYQLGIGHYVSRALDLAARLGIADLLREGPLDAADLAGACAAKPAPLRRVLRLLVSVGVFEEDAAGRFGLTLLRLTRVVPTPANVALIEGAPVR